MQNNVETQHNRTYSWYIGSLCNVAFQMASFTWIMTSQVFVEIWMRWSIALSSAFYTGRKHLWIVFSFKYMVRHVIKTQKQSFISWNHFNSWIAKVRGQPTVIRYWFMVTYILTYWHTSNFHEQCKDSAYPITKTRLIQMLPCAMAPCSFTVILHKRFFCFKMYTCIGTDGHGLEGVLGLRRFSWWLPPSCWCFVWLLSAFLLFCLWDSPRTVMASKVLQCRYIINIISLVCLNYTYFCPLFCSLWYIGMRSSG